MIYSNLNFAISHSKWLIGNGAINFWKDKWHDNVLFYNDCPYQDITVFEAFTNKHFKNQFIIGLCDHDQILFSDSKDRLICTLNSDGNINLADIYNAIKDSKPVVSWLTNFWNSFTPPKMSIFCWKIINSAVPVDSICQRNNVHLASKCVCCNGGNVESVNHLFLLGDTAWQVWGFFGNILNINTNHSSISTLFHCWMKAGNNSSQIGCIINLLGVAIPWCIWLFRNNIRFGNCNPCNTSIFVSIYQIIHKANALIKPKKKATYEEILMLDILGLKPIPVKFKVGKWCKWLPPTNNRFKLNVDGACYNDSCYGGGILRDDKGCMLIAFSLPINDGPPLHSEIWAAIKGINMCIEHNLNVDILEMDSLLLYKYLMNPSKCPWIHYYSIKKCLSLLNNFNPLVTLSYVYRESNSVSDALAKSHSNDIFFSHLTMPSSCRKLYINDIQGLHHYRPP